MYGWYLGSIRDPPPHRLVPEVGVAPFSEVVEEPVPVKPRISFFGGWWLCIRPALPGGGSWLGIGRNVCIAYRVWRFREYRSGRAP